MANRINETWIDSGSASQGSVLTADGSGNAEFLQSEQSIQIQFNSEGGGTSKTVFIADEVTINSINFNLSDITSLSYSTFPAGGSTITSRADIASINAVAGDKYLIINATYNAAYSGLASIEILYNRS